MTRFISSLPVLISAAAMLSSAALHAQWLDWLDDTENRLQLVSVANSDDEEKDVFTGDFNKDGWPDMIVVRKEPFSSPNEPAKSDLLLINQQGIMVDQTFLYAPEFITNATFARDLYIDDFDGDTWPDVIIANTFSQQPLFYRNLGDDENGDWLGFQDESAIRFPILNEGNILFCAVWGGDVNGDGFKDIYFVNYNGSPSKDYLLINDGSGFFTNESQARLGNLRNSAFGTAVQFHDMDQDGDLDIIKVSTLYNVAPWNAIGTFLLFNNGNGTFTNWQNLTPSAAPYMFEVADFNLDGILDLYVVDDGQDFTITVDSFVPNTSLAITKTIIPFSSTNGFGGNVHAIDLDLDGDMDIGISDVDVDIPPCNSGRRLAFYRNDNGVFSDPYGNVVYQWADNSYDFAFLDINGDGLQDFITGKCSGYGLFMSDNCDLAPNASDYDQDGLNDACDPCPTNPSPNCEPDVNFPVVSTEFNIARQWNEMLLASIRKDFARPTVHARNLFHTSIAMWDAWAVFDDNACPFLLGQTVDGFTCNFDGFQTPVDIQAARDTAITYACYRLLTHRFANSPNAVLLSTAYNTHMQTLGMDIGFNSVDYGTGSAAALGNYIAQCIIDFGLQDGSNEQNAYANTSYDPVNIPLIVDLPGNPDISDLNRWQEITLDLFIDQSGNAIPGATPPFLSPEWGQVSAFALEQEDMTTNNRDGFDYLVYHDPGTPPLISMDGSGDSEYYKWNFVTTAIWSSHLDPTDGVMWDISPASLGNRNELPATVADYPSFYNQLDGGTTNNGHQVNPATGLPYQSNIVPRADYARVLAEFWADGPESETPPGHWFTIFNYVADHPEIEKRYKGTGPVLDDMEWDVKGYLTLGGAMHDVAITTWGIKGWYDYIRPISAIRAMADLGQSSDTLAASYHPAGLPLIPDYIELVEPGDPLAGVGNEHVGKIKLKAWRGHKVINNIDSEFAGVGWILAENWEPYQRPSFVTPPFAGYVSGHSSFSRAAAEVMTLMTGDEYFPGGMGEFTAPINEFLVFEDGPSVDIHLQWATYRDAADESALSRIWGGIHPPTDDIPARKIGIEVGIDAFYFAENYFTDSDNDGLCNAFDLNECIGDLNNDGTRSVADLLILLSDFGCEGLNCIGDIDGNGTTSTNDLIGGFLPFYGVPCE